MVRVWLRSTMVPFGTICQFVYKRQNKIPLPAWTRGYLCPSKHVPTPPPSLQRVRDIQRFGVLASGKITSHSRRDCVGLSPTCFPIMPEPLQASPSHLFSFTQDITIWTKKQADSLALAYYSSASLLTRSYRLGLPAPKYCSKNMKKQSQIWTQSVPFSPNIWLPITSEV